VEDKTSKHRHICVANVLPVKVVLKVVSAVVGSLERTHSINNEECQSRENVSVWICDLTIKFANSSR
jgi:ribosome maturation protein Sdo1